MKSRSLAVVLSSVAALLVGAAVAFATHAVQFSYSVSPTKVGAIANSTASATIANVDTQAATDARFHLAPGTLVAHADDATSPVSPPPINGDQVGAAKVTASAMTLFGCTTATVDATGTWVDPINTAIAPAGAVGQIHLEGSFLGTTFQNEAFIVPSAGDTLQAAGHTDLVVLGLNETTSSTTPCPGSSLTFTVNTFGNAKNSSGAKTKRVTQRNPNTVGTKTVYADYNDVNGVNHVGSASYEITRR